MNDSSILNIPKNILSVFQEIQEHFESVENKKTQTVFDEIQPLLSSIHQNDDLLEPPIAFSVKELRKHIFSFLSPLHLRNCEAVNRSWNDSSGEILVERINQEQLKLGDVFKTEPLLSKLKNKPIIHTAKAFFNRNVSITQSMSSILNWLRQYNRGAALHYANFSGLAEFSCGFKDFDNTCLEKLTEICPNLRYLSIPDSGIKADALRHLTKLPNLQKLIIFNCRQLESDALKHLAELKNLRQLEIGNCKQLAPKSLEFLGKLKDLRCLNLYKCKGLEPNALEQLKNFPELKTLNIAYCNQLEQDGLKHLAHTPHLKFLKMRTWLTVEPDALKHLAYVPELEELYIGCCRHLEGNALKHLEKTRKLKVLDITECDQLEFNTLQYLVNIPEVEVLRLRGCDQLDPNLLPYLECTPNLKFLDISECDQFDENTIALLKQKPGLTVNT